MFFMHIIRSVFLAGMWQTSGLPKHVLFIGDDRGRKRPNRPHTTQSRPAQVRRRLGGRKRLGTEVLGDEEERWEEEKPQVEEGRAREGWGRRNWEGGQDEAGEGGIGKRG